MRLTARSMTEPFVPHANLLLRLAGEVDAHGPINSAVGGEQVPLAVPDALTLALDIA